MRSEAPWTAEQVESLNAFQNHGMFHPFTGKRKPNGDKTVLIATPEGWRETPEGPVVQTWAHDFMENGEWKKNFPGTLPSVAERQISGTQTK